jgi:hypothetical protein
MRRRNLLVTLAVALAVAATVALMSWPRTDRFARQNLAHLQTSQFPWGAFNHFPPGRFAPENLIRMRPGMSQADLEKILGPEGDSRTGPARLTGDNCSWFVGKTDGMVHLLMASPGWVDDTGWLRISRVRGSDDFRVEFIGLEKARQ